VQCYGRKMINPGVAVV